MTTYSCILAAINDPEKLEQLYREDHTGFTSNYLSVLAEFPDSMLLRAWRARLEYVETRQHQMSAVDILIMVILCIISGSLLKIPDWTSISDSDFYPRMLVLIPMSAMFFYTMYMRKWPLRTTMAGLGFIGITALIMVAIPDNWDDVYELACFNLPFLLWACYGTARLGTEYRSAAARIEFLRFTGEFIIHAGLLVIGGGILLFLTDGLFNLLDISSRWILEYPAVYGCAAIPLVAAWATDSYSAARRLVPLLARIFSPLLLLLTLTYMTAMALNTEELFHDRSTLLIYNILLLCVLATAIFTQTGHGEQKYGRFLTGIISLMVFSTLVLDAIAVTAICWRIIEFSLTANRLAVLGSNLIIFGNLASMGHGYIRYWKNLGSLQDIEVSIAAYLPAYLYWTFFSTFIQPWIFRY
ncbi:hypothetical protein [Maridesulfovibrio sp. FT414]|uniref:hypothetical protein n=1 Tax=Maridesulfovibrio sp. FT414 TaxID=2979469 RepID=UPI003D804DC8